MKINDLFRENRSYRRFLENERVSPDLIIDWVNNARLAACSRNIQAQRYRIITDKDTCAKVFPQLTWAAALKDWSGPKEGERPAAYVLIGRDSRLPGLADLDTGIAAEALRISAIAAGYGSCLLASINKRAIIEQCDLPDWYQLDLVLALGNPAETVIIDELAQGQNDLDYYRDDMDNHHVPKRNLEDLLI